jgi:hypothetical protein
VQIEGQKQKKMKKSISDKGNSTGKDPEVDRNSSVEMDHCLY